MATQQTTGEVQAFPGPPQAAVALFAERLLARHSAHEIAEAVEVLIDVLDMLGGDAELEDDDPDACTASDDGCGPVPMNGQVYWGSDEF
jgi:hypothetical protein